MRVIAKRKFLDLTENKIREPGEQFKASEERYRELFHKGLADKAPPHDAQNMNEPQDQAAG